MQDVLLIIPSYNEEKNIERVVGEIKERFPWLDYLVVNDGSTIGRRRSAGKRAIIC